jgi:hypothetical protein
LLATARDSSRQHATARDSTRTLSAVSTIGCTSKGGYVTEFGIELYLSTCASDDDCDTTYTTADPDPRLGSATRRTACTVNSTRASPTSRLARAALTTSRADPWRRAVPCPAARVPVSTARRRAWSANDRVSASDRSAASAGNAAGAWWLPTSSASKATSTEAQPSATLWCAGPPRSAEPSPGLNQNSSRTT